MTRIKIYANPLFSRITYAIDYKWSTERYYALCIVEWVVVGLKQEFVNI